MAVKIPEALRKIIEDKAYGHVITKNPSGSPQVSMVWLDVDGDDLLFNTNDARKKTLNLKREPRVVVSMQDRNNPQSYAIFYGKVKSITDDANNAHIDKLVSLLALVSETAPQLFNAADWGGDLSGRALKILLLRTLAKVNRRRRYYGEAIPNLLVKAQQAEGIENPVRPSIQWPDGLPQDILEAIEAETQKRVTETPAKAASQVWSTPVRRTNGPVSALQELADAKTLALQAQGEAAGLRAAIDALAKGQALSADQIKDAARKGAEEALKGGVKVTIDIPQED